MRSFFSALKNEHDPEWANRRRLLTGRKRLSRRNFVRMRNALIGEHPPRQIVMAYIAKEELRRLLSAVNMGGDPHMVRRRLHTFLAWYIDSQRVPGHRHHQRPHRGLQPAREDRETLGMRVPQP